MHELTIEIGEVKFLDDILADVADKMHEVVSFPVDHCKFPIQTFKILSMSCGRLQLLLLNSCWLIVLLLIGIPESTSLITV